MTISNIGREPRRELTEQWYGFMTAFVLFTVWLCVGLLMCLLCDGTVFVSTAELIAAMGLSIPILAVGVGVIYGMHALGESVCNAMARRGNDPRPKQRYI